MHAFLSFLTALSVGLHLALGCCAHHTHAERDAGNQHSGHEMAGSHSHSLGCSLEHAHLGEEPTAPPCPHQPHDDCHENHCSCVITGKTTLEFATSVTLLLPPDSLLAPATQLSAPQASYAIHVGGFVSFPVRLHLFQQVMLI